MALTSLVRELPSLKRNVKLDIKTWNALRNLKKPNETFNEVILAILKERTQSIGGDNLKAIKYHRKVLFLEIEYAGKLIGIEFEYNDVKNEPSAFTLDLEIRKIFYGRRIINPSIFFGIDNSRKHFNQVFLSLYLICVSRALTREFRIQVPINQDWGNILFWRKLYHGHSLSEDSFISDIEEPLRLSEEEKMDTKIKERIKKSLSNAIWNLIQ